MVNYTTNPSLIFKSAYQLTLTLSLNYSTTIQALINDKPKILQKTKKGISIQTKKAQKNWQTTNRNALANDEKKRRTERQKKALANNKKK